MKKITLLLSSILIGGSIYAQQPPTGTASPAINWRRGGNFQGGGAGPNVFGTMWNSPIYTYTNGTQRMVINGNTGLTNGFVGINTNNPQYQLHVNGSGVANVVYISM